MASKPTSTAIPQQDKDSHLPVVQVGGRYLSQYNPEKALIVLEGLAEGRTLNELTRGVAGMPHPTTFRRWMVNNPELASAYRVAMQVSASSLEEEALDTARAIAKMPKDGVHVRASEVKLTQLRWSMERRDPAKFGTRTAVSVKVPIQIITPLDLGGGQTIQDIYTVKAQVPRIPAEGPGEIIVEETPKAPVPRGPRKQVLTPRLPGYKPTPFGQVMRDMVDKGKQAKQAEAEEEPTP